MEEGVEGRAKSVVDGLNRISIESPAISIERAGKKIREVAQHVDRGVVVSGTLIALVTYHDIGLA